MILSTEIVFRLVYCEYYDVVVPTAILYHTEQAQEAYQVSTLDHYPKDVVAMANM